MTLEEKLKKIQSLKKEVTNKYIEINKIQKEVIEEMLDSKTKSVEISKGLQAVLVSFIEKKIDYDKLTKDYPDIYVLGLKTTFSKKQALNCISSKVLESVLKDCIITEKSYDIKYKRGVRK